MGCKRGSVGAVIMAMIWVSRLVVAAVVPFVLLLAYLCAAIVSGYGFCFGFYAMTALTLSLAAMLFGLVRRLSRLAKIAETIWTKQERNQQ